MINQYDLDGHYVSSFMSVMDAAKSFGEDWQKAYPSIYKCCRTLRPNKMACGFQWRESENTLDIQPYQRGTRAKYKIRQYAKDGTYLQTFDTAKAAGEAVGSTHNAIRSACSQKTLLRGFQWRKVLINSPDAEAEDIEPYAKEKKSTAPHTHGGGAKPKSVRQYDIQGNYLKTYKSIGEASKDNNIAFATITAACKAKRSGGGYYWLWADVSKASNINVPKAKFVNQYDLEGHYIQSFRSLKEAAENVDVYSANISKACSSFMQVRDFQWRISDNTEDIEAYVMAVDDKTKTKAKVRTRQTNQYDLNGHFLKAFTSIKEAAESVGGTDGQIRRADRLENCIAYGYMWRITEKISDIDPYIPKKR